MGGKAWSDEDRNYVCENAATLSKEEIATHLGRTVASVQICITRNGFEGKDGRKKRSLDTYHRKGEIEIGQEIGRLTIKDVFIKQTDVGERTFCYCECTCGKTVERSAAELKVRDNHSCGCGKNQIKHGLVGTRIYGHWCGMRDRCLNPNYADYRLYGGRGITIVKEWDDPAVFARWAMENGYEEGLTLDRKNNDIGYSPDNCRWSTPMGQANNRRNNRLLTVFGETKTISEWSRDPRCVACEMTIRYRVRNGWSNEDSVLIPAGVKKSRSGKKAAVKPGDHYGELEVLSVELKNRGGQNASWCKCLCSCGRSHECWASCFKRSETPSCGHVLKEKARDRIVAMNRKRKDPAE